MFQPRTVQHPLDIIDKVNNDDKDVFTKENHSPVTPAEIFQASDFSDVIEPKQNRWIDLPELDTMAHVSRFDTSQNTFVFEEETVSDSTEDETQGRRDRGRGGDQGRFQEDLSLQMSGTFTRSVHQRKLLRKLWDEGRAEAEEIIDQIDRDADIVFRQDSDRLGTEESERWTVSDIGENRVQEEDRKEYFLHDSLASSYDDITTRIPSNSVVLDSDQEHRDVSSNDRHAEADLHFQNDKIDKCIDKNCVNPLNRASAKAYQSANSKLEDISLNPQSPAGFLDHPKELAAVEVISDSDNEKKTLIEDSSTGERKRLKRNVRSRLRSTREIKENGNFPSLQHTSSSVLPSSMISQPQPPVYLASSSSKQNTSIEAEVEELVLTPKQEKFYSKYDSTEGVTTAVVLGGFFVFVCLLVVYKTKLKPMWKDRQARRHDNTPATKSDLSSHNHLHKDFECIPLQTLHSETCTELSDDDIFYSDEFGNYVFPIFQQPPGTCSCPHSNGTRRPSQISALSTAYTVKSLPGAMLYIPVENDYNTPVSLKRSLSDPEIYFPSAVRHSLIVAVNGIMPHEKLSSSNSSTHRVNEQKSPTIAAIPAPPTCQLSVHGPVETHANVRPVRISDRNQNNSGETLQIDINVIQPTPNISPSHSLRSISGDSKDLEPDANVNENFAGIPFLIVPPSPVRIRRVSFSDTSIDNNDEDDELISMVDTTAPEIAITDATETSTSVTSKRRSRCVRQASLQARGSESPTSARHRRSMVSRQMTLPCNFSASMSYLQVPGQENRSNSSARMSPLERRLRLPSGGIDGSQHSESLNYQSSRKRLGYQSSIESYYSFASEGDGDIFASSENIRRGMGRVQRQTSFCIPDSNISEYSEFNEDFHSSISDLFRRGRLENQGTFSEQGSIRSLSIDQEEITFELPGMRAEEINAAEEGTENVSQGGNPNFLSVPAICEFSGSQEYAPDLPYDDYEGYISSSCSISMSSDLESSHQITVPVYIEPAPPEIRFYGGSQPPTEVLSEYWREETAHHDYPRLQHQETMHTDSGLDTEEICPATPTGGRFSGALSPGQVSPCIIKKPDSSADGKEGDLRMVLVRDIGIQCCAESPNLNMHRRSKSAENAVERLERPTSLCASAGKFQSELLF